MQSIVSSSVLILVVIALRYVLRGKLSLRMQYALWLLVLVRLLVPVSFGASDLSVMNAVPERAPTVQQGTYKQDIVGEQNDAPANAGTVGIPAQSMNEAAPPDLVQNVTTATVTAPTVEKTDWARIAKTVWLAGAAALGLVFLAVNLRFGKKPISSTYYVSHADFIACHNQTYLTKYDIISELKPHGSFLLNCEWTENELEQHVPGEILKYIADNDIKFYIIDANKESQALGLGNRSNMVLQAAFFKLANVIPVEDAVAHMKDAVKKTYGLKGCLLYTSDAADEL